MFRQIRSFIRPLTFVGAATVWRPREDDIDNQAGIHIEYTEKPRPLNSIFRYGQPAPYMILSYSNHVVCYDFERRIPRYVAERITKEHISGKVSRQNVAKENGGFKSDPNVDELFSSYNADYASSGWSRGHMAAAANHKHDLSAMNDTFYLTNIVPQNGDNNSGFWNRLEWYCRGLAKRYDSVYVVTGPLFIPRRYPSQGPKGSDKRTLNVDLIGKSGVYVPTHLYKAVLVEKDGKPYAAAAFIVPNQPILPGTKISDYQVPLVDLERVAGMKFFHLIHSSSSTVLDLCRYDNSHCRLSADEEKRLEELERRGKGEFSKNKQKNIAAAA